MKTITTAPTSIEIEFLCCPYPDHGDLQIVDSDRLSCRSCGREFISLNGRPVLLDQSRSIFTSAEVARFADQRQFPKSSGWRYRLRKLLPAAEARDKSLDLLINYARQLPIGAAVLVIGCGFTREFYTRLFENQRLFLSDVTLQGDAMLVCDGGQLPFRDQSLDCIVIDQVLEHALEPLMVVSEISRCLKLGGLVYSGIPFHTPVHAFPYDFQRYSPLGHRLLFRNFQELQFAITQGPISSLSLSLIGFTSSLSANRWWRRGASFIVRLLFRPFLWLDRSYRGARALTIPAASVFIGSKQSEPVDIKQIISNWGKQQ